MDEKTIQLYSLLIYLTGCALHDIVPDKKYTENMDLKQLYYAAQAQTLTAMVCMALERGNTFEHADEKVVLKWREAKDKAIRKNMMLDVMREQIFDKLEQEKIWYMPLKGSILKALYPKYGMRQMADNDILIDANGQKKVKDIMEQLGFETTNFGKGNHDVYEKPPVYNFEMHTSLFGRTNKDAWFLYYGKVKDRLIKDADNNYGYHFSEEDFYLYMMVHGCKHFEGSGTGLRTLVDTYVYERKKGAQLDWDYIEKEAEKLEIAAYETANKALAEKLFEVPVNPETLWKNLSSEEQKALNIYIGAGTYGTTEISVKNKLNELQEEGQIKKETKRKYCWRRLFPDLHWYEMYEPFIYRHKWLIPFFIPFRVVRGILIKRKKIIAEIKALRHI